MKRTPVALAGVTRYLVLRSENDAGPAATMHPLRRVRVGVSDARQPRVRGPGPALDHHGAEPLHRLRNVCRDLPANLANGGQTLRVMEAPTAAWFEALVEFPAEPAASPASHESGATR